MNALIEQINKMYIAQKTLMDRTSNRIYKLEAKMEQMEQDIDKTIDLKIEEALHNLFKKDEDLQSKVKKAIKPVLESEYLKYRLWSNIVGNPKVYSQKTVLTKSMAETSTHHHP